MYNVNENMVVYMFRYALGRMTYAVGDVSDYLIDNWHRLSNFTKSQIVQEIRDAIERKEAGMDCDVDSWRRILLLDKTVNED